MNHSSVIRQIEQAWAGGGQRGMLLPSGHDVSIGLEERTARDRYAWDGMKRGNAECAIVQYTLTGWGAYADAHGRVERVPAGSFFISLVPSPHRYFLPAESSAWRFFYFIFQHPFAIERLRQNMLNGDAVQVADPDQPFTASLLRLWTGIRRGDFIDDLTVERGIIGLALDHDRLLRDRRAGPGAGDALLTEVRSALLLDPTRPVQIAELADAAGMSRSAYAHRFAKRTGLAPARYIMQVRLGEVRRGLLEGDESLSVLAARTGFADANHLCKAFRRAYHQSPGQYRRQMGG